jgi:hypothetical protein
MAECTPPCVACDVTAQSQAPIVEPTPQEITAGIQALSGRAMRAEAERDELKAAKTRMHLRIARLETALIEAVALTGTPDVDWPPTRTEIVARPARHRGGRPPCLTSSRPRVA